MKVSLYLDEELWAKFKEAVLRKHGTLRKLSDEVENLLRFSLVGEEVELAFKRLNIETKAVSIDAIKRERPKLRGLPSELIIREMRGRRIAEALSGQ
ncbi:hypothetical protein KAI30_02420 [Candidatus Bathyarchaeota archaeon]|nr:hypothetical protein [Candidatus Bathyarchaeota archaeon]